jgi:hypothetical protein
MYQNADQEEFQYASISNIHSISTYLVVAKVRGERGASSE